MGLALWGQPKGKLQPVTFLEGGTGRARGSREKAGELRLRPVATRDEEPRCGPFLNSVRSLSRRSGAGFTRAPGDRDQLVGGSALTGGSRESEFQPVHSSAPSSEGSPLSQGACLKRWQDGSVVRRKLARWTNRAWGFSQEEGRDWAGAELIPGPGSECLGGNSPWELINNAVFFQQ